MATKSRFESFVEERVNELAAPRRAVLKAAYDAEKAKIDAKLEKYTSMIQQGISALTQKVFAKAEADGCDVQDRSEVDDSLANWLKEKVKTALGLEPRYDYDAREHRWPEGTAIRKAKAALDEYNALCRREARRIVVYKMDLGMKPEKFEAMLAETAKLFE
jgi:hypothetical protein